MRISAINNNINFGDLYLVNGNYSDKQKNVIEQIKTVLRTPSEKFNNRTPEEFYKTNDGIDFFLASSSKYKDSIYLSGKMGVKSNGVGIDKVVTSSDSFDIGNYDETHPFLADDIEIGKKEFKKSIFGAISSLGLIFLTLGAYIFAGMIAVQADSAKKAKDTAQPLIENVDSLALKVKPIISDTTKVLKAVK